MGLSGSKKIYCQTASSNRKALTVYLPQVNIQIPVKTLCQRELPGFRKKIFINHEERILI